MNSNGPRPEKAFQELIADSRPDFERLGTIANGESEGFAMTGQAGRLYRAQESHIPAGGRL
jgi:hypothetical protein